MKPAWSATVDGDRALVRGYDAKRVLQLIGATPYWSNSGRGWVVAAAVVDDLSAYASVMHTWVAVHERKAATA